ncbi:MAG: CAP domain-containing protein [Gemmatimonadota bacterium]|nr:CAP domain-containing protein [Gemmatimonadota bacterium]
MKPHIPNSIVILLLLNLAACSPRETVTVSGAVSRPGDVGFRADWTLANYVAEAGGYLAEADTGRVALARDAADSVVAGPHGNVLKWAVEDAPVPLPSDLITVPLKSYRVRFDTVMAIRDLRLEWKDHTYRMELGKAVLGTTQRGVVAAVVFGNGEVARRASGGAAGSFQYLYITMHPDRYGSLFPATGFPVADLEALEDAAAVHRYMFRTSAFRAGERTHLPPDGHLRVQAGVWLRPKNASHPGDGLRKRHYDDGRVWTTFPDGRQRWRYANGRIVVQFPDKTRETRFPDGSVQFEDALGGMRRSYPDGRMVYVDAGGNRHRVYGDGRQEWRHASGNRMTIFPDGRREHRFASGTVRTVETGGVERTVFPDGTRHVRYPDGRVENVVPGGVRETRYPDGSVIAITPEGHRIRVFANGRQFTRMNDGTTIEQYPDGRKIQKNQSGETLEVFPDRSRRTVYSDGSETVRRPDGVRVARLEDGTVIEEFPDGRIVQTDTSGVRLEFLTPDRYVVTDREGNRIEAGPDSTATKQFAEPFRYRGSIRRDLIGLERVPERISPGMEASIRGTVGDVVKSLSMAAFALPDGDVLDMATNHKAGRFSGFLLIRETGHYRLQIQGKLENGDAVMLEDRMLTVGNPKPLAKPAIQVSLYPGDAAAGRRLMALVNQVRARKGRMRLKWDDELAYAAASHLQDMLAYGSVSHRSPMYGNLTSRLERLNITFEVALENLATAPSLEEAHWHLMLSAEHRRNILDPRLTHIGIAAARERGQVWVAEIFKRRH